MARPTMKRPQKNKEVDTLMEKINTVSSKKLDPKIEALPRVRYPTNIERVSACVLKAFEAHATQPTFKVLSVRPNRWHVDSFHIPGEERLSFREFAPCVRSVNLKQRMYHEATFANVRLVANTLLASVLEELVVKRRSLADHEEIVVTGGATATSCKMNVFLAPCSDPTRWEKQVSLLWGNDEAQEVQPLDSGNGIHLTTWVFLNGGGYVEIDLATQGGPTFDRHGEAPPSAQRLLVETALSQGRVAMSKREEEASLDKTLDEIGKNLETEQEAMKRERARESRRRRDKRRRERKKSARAAALVEQIVDTP